MRPDLAIALAALLAAAPANAVELGKLFHTPEEREALDKRRRGEPEAAPSAGSAAKPRVTGFVRRSDGRNTVWIDGRPVPTASPRAAPLLDPRVVRDMPRTPPPAPRAEPDGKGEDAPRKGEDAPRKGEEAARKPEEGTRKGEAEVKR